MCVISNGLMRTQPPPAAARLAPSELDRRFAAWAVGRTGYPLVDACMRSLDATGWLTFRMRCLCVSFACYHCWLHWRRPAAHLARRFLDFEASERATARRGRRSGHGAIARRRDGAARKKQWVSS